MPSRRRDNGDRPRRDPTLPRFPVLLAVTLLGLACAEAQSPKLPASNVVAFLPAAGDAIAGVALASPAVARVTTPAGAPIAGAQVEFSVASGGGVVIDTIVTTDGAGRAATTWILGPSTGAQRLRATAADAEGQLDLTARRPSAGATYAGREGYVVYIPGELPVILSAPHGGELRPAEIPDRSWGTTVRDAFTVELTRAISDAFAERSGGRPHVILVRLHRTKLDANREVAEAAQGSRQAERAWAEFHAFIEAARAAVVADHGAGLYIDVHGHAHAIDRVELGYLISDQALQRSDAELNASAVHTTSSIRALVDRSAFPPAQVIRGETSLGTLVERRGYPAVPGSTQPHAAGEPYFSGGPNARRHGSRDGGMVSAVQLEVHRPGVRDTHANRVAFAHALADAIEEYLELHLGLALRERVGVAR